MIESAIFSLIVLSHNSHDLLRAEYNTVSKKIKDMDPFLNLAPSDFAVGIAGQIMKESRHKAINRELQLISRWVEWAMCLVGDIKQLLGITQWWQQSDAEYQKMHQYISNKKFVCIVEKLQGLVVSQLMELDRVNLAGTGVYYVSL